MDETEFRREYLTVQQAARYLGVSAQTLRRWDADGKLKSVRHPGNAYRYYKRSDLEPLKLEYVRAEQVNPGQLFTSTVVDIETNKRLREPQRGAHKAVREHFERNPLTPAVIQIPVGCGKTGIIATLPFGVSTGRVLVIAPNTTIRRGVAEALEVGNPKFFLGKTKVMESFAGGPFVAVLDGPQANIHDCTESHYVVTNIQQLASSADRWLPQFPPNFFDMILVDEGHHNVADSWKKVFDRFPNAKVVSLTATPFRSDGRRVTGDVIYRYSYSKAMLVGYIKQIHSINVAPSEIYFTYKGDTRRHSLQQVMELREEAWFRKGVALAPECNKSIVDASIQRMRELRARTGQKHQIIAAACSIDHARQVRALYEQRGLSAREVYSEMDEAKQERAMAELENLQIDCVVQVQMLGEGFDHPPLSVAAVFRPFRSLSPYVQFVGRIMRVMFQDDPANAANHGYVVSHVGLNNDANWRDFREFDLEDQQVFREWLESQGRTEVPEGGDGGDSGQPRRFDEQMLVHGELISDFVRQSFLDPGDDRILDKILDAVVPGVGVPFRSFMSRDQARDMLKKAQEKMLEATPQELPVTPQRRRQAARKRVADRPRSVAARILKDLGLSVAGYDVAKAIPGGGGSRNLAEVIRLVNREINERLGIANRQRGEVPAADLEAAMKDLDAIGDSVASRIGKALTHAKN
jgi:excisionase family DNA binding protein